MYLNYRYRYGDLKMCRSLVARHFDSASRKLNSTRRPPSVATFISCSHCWRVRRFRARDWSHIHWISSSWLLGTLADNWCTTQPKGKLIKSQ